MHDETTLNPSWSITQEKSLELLSQQGNSFTITATLTDERANGFTSYDQTVLIESIVLPSFDSSLSTELLMPGQAKSYPLPPISDGTYPLFDILVSGSELGPYLSINHLTRSIEYNGGFDQTVIDSIGLVLPITIQLKNNILLTSDPFAHGFEVQSPIKPAFDPEVIPVETVMPGIVKQWTLPLINKGTFEVTTVEIYPETAYSAYFTIDYSDLAAPTLSFDDGALSANLRP